MSWSQHPGGLALVFSFYQHSEKAGCFQVASESSRGQLKGLSHLVGMGMVLLRAGAQGVQREVERSLESKAGRKAKWKQLDREMEEGQHIAITLRGMEIKCCVCLIQEKEHRGESSGRADPGEKLTSSSTSERKEEQEDACKDTNQGCSYIA